MRQTKLQHIFLFKLSITENHR